MRIWFRMRFTKLLLENLSRKEVFQPHLPVRLPCYDLAPVTCFTLGRSFGLRTLGTPSFHGLTGGVYKAREPEDGFRRLASGRPVATLCTTHCNTCVAPDVRAVLI